MEGLFSQPQYIGSAFYCDLWHSIFTPLEYIRVSQFAHVFTTFALWCCIFMLRNPIICWAEKPTLVSADRGNKPHKLILKVLSGWAH